MRGGGAAVIVVAAGRGTRLKSKTDKPYVRLGGKPLICHSLEVLQGCGLVREIIVVVHPGRVASVTKGLLRRQAFPKIRAVVAGGETRQQSVMAGLQAVSPGIEIVVVHDAARPFITAAMIRDVIACARRGFGATVGMPAAQTIKRVDKDGLVLETPPRETLREIQTPQAFPKRLLWKAHQAAILGGIKATDDAGLVEQIGGRVKVVPGSPRNFKVTTQEDLLLASLLLKKG